VQGAGDLQWVIEAVVEDADVPAPAAGAAGGPPAAAGGGEGGGGGGGAARPRRHRG
jgi:hypothetical protein